MELGQIESKDNCLSDSLFIQFLDVLIKETENYCLTDFLVINLTDYTISIPKLNHNITNVIIPIRIVSFVDCSLDYNNTIIGHTNVAIYNTTLNTLQLFEPHGKKYTGYNPLELDVSGMIHYAISQIFKQEKMILINLGGMQYKQNLQFPKTGHCTVWCCLFIHYHLLDLNIQELVHWEPKKLDSYIRRYLTKIKSETISNLNFKIE